jgi:hypothetical protein
MFEIISFVLKKAFLKMKGLLGIDEEIELLAKQIAKLSKKPGFDQAKIRNLIVVELMYPQAVFDAAWERYLKEYKGKA